MGTGIFLGRHRISVTEPELPYLTFSSPNAFTLKVSNKGWNGTMYYSTDAINWATWTKTEISVSAGKAIYIRGAGNTVITGSFSMYAWTITGTNVACTGNIENLLDWRTVAEGNHPTMANYCYMYMFSGCTALTTAPALPATTMADYCYYSMFSGCTALTTAPALPATTMAESCYYRMFYGCTALTTAPALPATTMANYCYYDMFSGCTALTAAPALPATTMEKSCYNRIFSGCTALTTAPALPATTMADNCYYGMFYGCTALTTIPAIYLTGSASKACSYMVAGCSGVKVSTSKTGVYKNAYRIPISGYLAGSNVLQNMFDGTGGSFTGTPTSGTTYYTANEIVYP